MVSFDAGDAVDPLLHRPVQVLELRCLDFPAHPPFTQRVAPNLADATVVATFDRRARLGRNVGGHFDSLERLEVSADAALLLELRGFGRRAGIDIVS